MVHSYDFILWEDETLVNHPSIDPHHCHLKGDNNNIISTKKVLGMFLLYSCASSLGSSVQDPDPDVLGPPGFASKSIVYLVRYGSGSFHLQKRKSVKTWRKIFFKENSGIRIWIH
jgi:hypothetical protein